MINIINQMSLYDEQNMISYTASNAKMFLPHMKKTYFHQENIRFEEVNSLYGSDILTVILV